MRHRGLKLHARERKKQEALCFMITKYKWPGLLKLCEGGTMGRGDVERGGGKKRKRENRNQTV